MGLASEGGGGGRAHPSSSMFQSGRGEGRRRGGGGEALYDPAFQKRCLNHRDSLSNKAMASLASDINHCI